MSNEEKAKIMRIYGRVIAEIEFFQCGNFKILFRDGDVHTFSSVYELDQYMERKVDGE